MSYIRFFDPPFKRSYFLFGPRGTGKSSFIDGRYQNNVLKIDLLKDRDFRKFSSDPDYLLEILDANPDIEQVIIDEVQKSPSLLSTIHHAMEQKKWKQIQFILTGSSSRKLKSKGVDLLAGRALIKNLHPFMAAELGSDFSLSKALESGMLPIVWSSQNPNETLESYIGVYLREEVKQEALVRDLAAFSRFLEAMSFSHAQVLNLSNVTSDCGVKRPTATGYLEILEDLLLGMQISPFKKSNRKEVIEHGKFYYFDVGVFRSLRPAGPLDEPEKIAGAALEGFVLQHLKAWTAYREEGDSIYFWRTRACNEVDFIIYGKSEFYAIEVKGSSKIRTGDLSGLNSFGEDYPQAKRVCLYLGKDRFLKNGILCYNLEEFITRLKPTLSLCDVLRF
ncbi:MAG: ATP-binding protein [Deltaproteobacteria bacterium]|nr:ATP-binding protein [Deltaproteobacteria bacterium]